MNIVLRTYGGLGNQLFQYFYTLCLSGSYQSAQIKSLHSSNYQHQFMLEKELDIFPSPGWLSLVVSSFRIPRLLEILNLSRKSRVKIFGNIFLDGYFQNVQYYKSFGRDEISHSIQLIKELLGISSEAHIDRRLGHLRLGDYFRSLDEETYHLRLRLSSLSDGDCIITNKQHVLEKELASKDIQPRNISLLDTHNWRAVNVLKKMAQYKTIQSNSSTIAFWAALLANSELEIIL